MSWSIANSSVVFDEGPLQEDPVAAKKFCESFPKTMNAADTADSSELKCPLLEAHRDIWQRIVQVWDPCFPERTVSGRYEYSLVTDEIYSALLKVGWDIKELYTKIHWQQTEIQKRYKRYTMDYCSCLTAQVEICSSSNVPDVERYLELRRGSIATMPALDMTE